jgi:hypothetical protein
MMTVVLPRALIPDGDDGDVFRRETFFKADETTHRPSRPIVNCQLRICRRKIERVTNDSCIECNSRSTKGRRSLSVQFSSARFSLCFSSLFWNRARRKKKEGRRHSPECERCKMVIIVDNDAVAVDGKSAEISSASEFPTRIFSRDDVVD